MTKNKITINDLAVYLCKLNENYFTSNLRLQKSLFIVFGGLSQDEKIFKYVDVASFNFSAWQYGPLNVKLYEEVKKCSSVEDYINKLNSEGTKITQNSELKAKIEELNEKLIIMNPFDLIDFTHSLDCWKNVKQYTNMSNEQIIRDFKNVIL